MDKNYIEKEERTKNDWTDSNLHNFVEHAVRELVEERKSHEEPSALIDS